MPWIYTFKAGDSEYGKPITFYWLDDSLYISNAIPRALAGYGLLPVFGKGSSAEAKVAFDALLKAYYEYKGMAKISFPAIPSPSDKGHDKRSNDEAA